MDCAGGRAQQWAEGRAPTIVNLGTISGQSRTISDDLGPPRAISDGLRRALPTPGCLVVVLAEEGQTEAEERRRAELSRCVHGLHRGGHLKCRGKRESVGS